MQPPHRRDDASLVGGIGQGLYWQAGDGLIVRLAAREERRRQLAADQARLEACAPEGGIIHAPRAARPASRRRRDRIGAAGLAMALWMRLFADSA